MVRTGVTYVDLVRRVKPVMKKRIIGSCQEYRVSSFLIFYSMYVSRLIFFVLYRFIFATKDMLQSSNIAAVQKLVDHF